MNFDRYSDAREIYAELGVDTESVLERLAWLKEFKTLPFGVVWGEYLKRNNVSSGEVWIREMKAYEKDILSHRQ